MKNILFQLDELQDKDLIEWYDRQTRKGEAVRQTLRRGIRDSSTAGDLISKLRELFSGESPSSIVDPDTIGRVDDLLGQFD